MNISMLIIFAQQAARAWPLVASECVSMHMRMLMLHTYACMLQCIEAS